MCGVQTSSLDIYDLAKFAELFELEECNRIAFMEKNHESIFRLQSFFGKELCRAGSKTILPTKAGSELVNIALDVRESLEKISKLDQLLAIPEHTGSPRVLELA